MSFSLPITKDKVASQTILSPTFVVDFVVALVTSIEISVVSIIHWSPGSTKDLNFAF